MILVDWKKDGSGIELSSLESSEKIGMLLFVPYQAGLSDTQPPLKLDDGLLIMNTKFSREGFLKLV
jgi:hypothetical protein